MAFVADSLRFQASSTPHAYLKEVCLGAGAFSGPRPSFLLLHLPDFHSLFMVCAVSRSLASARGLAGAPEPKGGIAMGFLFAKQPVVLYFMFYFVCILISHLRDSFHHLSQ